MNYSKCFQLPTDNAYMCVEKEKFSNADKKNVDKFMDMIPDDVEKHLLQDKPQGVTCLKVLDVGDMSLQVCGDDVDHAQKALFRQDTAYSVVTMGGILMSNAQLNYVNKMPTNEPQSGFGPSPQTRSEDVNKMSITHRGFNPSPPNAK